MEYIEIILIIVLFCGQLYFCWQVFIKTKQISTFLPSINTIRIRKDYIRESKKTMVPPVIETLENNDNVKNIYSEKENEVVSTAPRSTKSLNSNKESISRTEYNSKAFAEEEFEDVGTNTPNTTKYFNTMKESIETGGFIFAKRYCCAKENALVEMAISDNGYITYRPVGPAIRLKNSMTKPFFNTLFENKATEGDTNIFLPEVPCLKKGRCKEVANGWQIIQKCVIDL